MSVLPKEALPLWTLHPRRREPRGQGLRADGPEYLPRAQRVGTPAASRGHVLACRAAGCTNPQPLDPSSALSMAQFGLCVVILAERGVKGGTGGRSPEQRVGNG